MSRRRPANRPAQVTDLSHEVATPTADDNNHLRTRIAGFNAELEQAHRRIAKLEQELQRSTTRIDILRGHLRRRTGALWTGFITLGGKAGYEMATSEWADRHWWVNLGQAAGLLIVGTYLVLPNVRKLLRLSSETADPEKFH